MRKDLLESFGIAAHTTNLKKPGIFTLSSHSALFECHADSSSSNKKETGLVRNLEKRSPWIAYKKGLKPYEDPEGSMRLADPKTVVSVNKPGRSLFKGGVFHTPSPDRWHYTWHGEPL